MKVFIAHKKNVLLALITLLVAFILSLNIITPSAIVYFGYAPRLVPIYSVDVDEKKVAISFDSAWGADKTLDIIKCLKDYNVSATFFLVGFWCEDYPDMVRAINDAGLEIGTHSNTHPDFTTLSKEQMREELEIGIKYIKNVVDKDIQLFRFPYGAYNNATINVANEFNLKCIQWDVDTLDWKGLSGKEILSRVSSKVKNGSIILCHNNSEHILDALPLILEYLINDGYTITSVGNLIYQSDYFIDHLGIQHKN